MRKKWRGESDMVDMQAVIHLFLLLTNCALQCVAVMCSTVQCSVNESFHILYNMAVFGSAPSVNVIAVQCPPTPDLLVCLIFGGAKPNC